MVLSFKILEHTTNVNLNNFDFKKLFKNGNILNRLCVSTAKNGKSRKLCKAEFYQLGKFSTAKLISKLLASVCVPRVDSLTLLVVYMTNYLD